MGSIMFILAVMTVISHLGLLVSMYRSYRQVHGHNKAIIAGAALGGVLSAPRGAGVTNAYQWTFSMMAWLQATCGTIMVIASTMYLPIAAPLLPVTLFAHSSSNIFRVWIYLMPSHVCMYE
jgi:hypothetical protein